MLYITKSPSVCYINKFPQRMLHYKIVSATNVARAGKRGNICVGNNVSSFARACTPNLSQCRRPKLYDWALSALSSRDSDSSDEKDPFAVSPRDAEMLHVYNTAMPKLAIKSSSSADTFSPLVSRLKISCDKCILHYPNIYT